MNIIKRIKGYCAGMHISVADLSRRTGLSRQTIHRIFKQEICSTDNLEKLLNSIDLHIILKKTGEKTCN